MAFQKAVRQQIKGRFAIDGPTGSGKTYTSLMLASALTGASKPSDVENGKIAFIDTERGSAKLYADLFNFHVEEMDYFDPLGYVELLNAAAEEGFEVVIVDSLSHAWEDEGGALDQVDKEAAKIRGNSYAAWRSVTPKHRKLVHTMLRSPLHVIATMRSKMDYVQEKDNNGKTTIRKIGLAPIQRAGMEYEFTFVCDMDLDHNIVVSKSRASALDGLVQNKPDAEWFEKFYTWLDKGIKPPRTKKELLEYGSTFNLTAAQIGNVLKERQLEFAGDDETWASMTDAIAQFVENNNGHGG